MSGAARRFAQNTRAPFTVLGSEATVVTPHDSRLHVLNAVATRIWELCDGEGATIDELVEALVEEFEVTAETARDECIAFIEDAVSRELVVVVE